MSAGVKVPESSEATARPTLERSTGESAHVDLLWMSSSSTGSRFSPGWVGGTKLGWSLLDSMMVWLCPGSWPWMSVSSKPTLVSALLQSWSESLGSHGRQGKQKPVWKRKTWMLSRKRQRRTSRRKQRRKKVCCSGAQSQDVSRLFWRKHFSLLTGLSTKSCCSAVHGFSRCSF